MEQGRSRDRVSPAGELIDGIGPAYVTAATVGALHGVEPGHGWPVAAVYALSRRRPWPAAVAAGAIVGGAHLVSSFAVVALFEALDRWAGLSETGWVGPIAGLSLLPWVSSSGGEGAIVTHSTLHTGSGPIVITTPRRVTRQPIAVCGGSRVSLSCWGSPTKRNSRSSLSAQVG